MPEIDPERLRFALGAKDITPAELGRRVDITTSYAARIVKGTCRLPRNPGLRRKIAHAINVPIDWIEVGEAA